MKKTIYIIFRNDDPEARSSPEKEKKILGLFERYDIPQVCAVIPSAENKTSFEDLNLIESCNWRVDFDELYWQITVLNEGNRGALMQIAYHSRKIDDEFLCKLDIFLRKITALNNVEFILPSQISEVAPWIEKTVKLHSSLIQVKKRLNSILGWKPQEQEFYLRSQTYYLKKIIKYRTIFFIFESLGLRRILGVVEFRGLIRYASFYLKNIVFMIRLVFLKRQKNDNNVLCLLNGVIVGGLEKVTMHTVRGLGSFGYQFHLFSTKGQSNKFCDNVLKVFSRKFILNGILHNRDPIFKKLFYLHLKKIIKKLNIQIIYIYPISMELASI